LSQAAFSFIGTEIVAVSPSFQHVTQPVFFGRALKRCN
jgi:hypothetical protein